MSDFDAIGVEEISPRRFNELDVGAREATKALCGLGIGHPDCAGTAGRTCGGFRYNTLDMVAARREAEEMVIDRWKGWSGFREALAKVMGIKPCNPATGYGKKRVAAATYSFPGGGIVIQRAKCHIAEFPG